MSEAMNSEWADTILERAARQFWASAHDATLIKMLAAGHTSRAIGDAIGRSEDAVRARWRLLGLPKRRAGRPRKVRS